MARLNGEWFRKKLTEKQKSQRALARHLSLDPGAITLTLNGKRRLQMDEAKQIAVFLGEPLEDVLRAAGLEVGSQSSRTSTPAPVSGDIIEMMMEKRADLQRQIDALDSAIEIMRK